MRPTGTGLAALVGGLVLLLLAALLRYPEPAVIGAGALAALLAALGWTVRGGSTLEVSRRFDPTTPRVGEQVQVELVVHNTGGRASLEALAVDRIDGRGYEVFIPALAAGQQAVTRYVFTAPRRGVLKVERLTVRRGDPLGLWASHREIGYRGDLYVHPSWLQVQPLVLAAQQEDEGAVAANSAAGGMVFHSLRDYQPGDPWRLISWRATARRQTPTVRHLVVPDESYQALVFEGDAHAYRSARQFEEAVRIAASLAVAVRAAGFGLDLVVTRDRQMRPLEPVEMRRAGSDRRALDLLTEARPIAWADGPATLTSALTDLEVHPEGAVLGVVTGQLEHVVEVTPGRIELADGFRSRYLRWFTEEARRKFQGVYVIEVGAQRPETGLPRGVVHLSVDDCEDFQRQWRTLTEP